MQPASAVEIFRDADAGSGGSFGSGYLLGAAHVLTARHVVCAPHQIATAVRGLRARQLSRPPAGARWHAASCIWEEPQLDLALLRLATPLSDEVARPLLGRVVGTDRVKCEALGFPRAQEQDNVWDTYRLIGELDPLTGYKSGFLHIAVDGPPPERPEGWRGMSGAAVFARGHLVGVIVRTNRAFAAGVLEAAPFADAVRAPGFPREPFGAQPYVHDVGGAAALLDPTDLTQHLYLADRRIQVGEAQRVIRRAESGHRKKPVVLVVGGVPEDELDVLVDRFRYHLLPALLARRGDVEQWHAEEEIALISWPSRSGDLRRLFHDLKAEMWEKLDLERAVDAEDEIDAGRVRALLNHRQGPRVFHTYIRAKVFAGDLQERLLLAWLGFWNDIAGGNLAETVIYMICLEHDLPPLPRWRALLPLGAKSERLRRFAERHLSRPAAAFDIALLEDLNELTWNDDIKAWLHDPVLHQRMPSLKPSLGRVEERIRSQLPDGEGVRMAPLRRGIQSCNFA